MASNGPRGAMRSLDRLKTLNQLPNLDEQLDEARRLCTTAERASMIARWILGKLSKDSEARQNADSWHLLRYALRLLPPARMQSAFGSFDFIHLMQSATADDPGLRVIESVMTLLEFLVEVSADPTGISVKALLRLDSSKAAPFIGHLLKLGVNIAPALVLWSFRKKSANDNELFAEHCLEGLASQLANDDFAVSSKKRKLDVDDGSSRHVVDATLEKLLALHVFRPARLAFFTEQSKSSVRDALKVLRDTSHTVTSSSLPRLLHVALRCTSITTPKQRQDEVPYVEAVFSALEECIGQHDAVVDVIRRMVEVLCAQGYSLSSSKLTEIMDPHSGLLLDVEGHVEWDLVAAVVKMDASFFVAEPFAGMVLQKVPNGKQFTESIVLPICNAYARQRSLPLLLNRWYDLLKRADGKMSLVDLPLDGLLETSLAPDQILSVVNSFIAALRKENEVVLAAIPLASILRAIQDDDLRDSLQSHLAELMDLLSHSKIIQQHPDQTSTSAFWNLMSTVFQLWFPLYVAKQTDPAGIGAKSMTLLETPLVRQALRSVTPSGVKTQESDPSHDKDVDAAAAFVAIVALRFRPYAECRTTCEALATQLLTHSSTLGILKRYPSLLLSLASTVTKANILKRILSSDDQLLHSAAVQCAQQSMQFGEDLQQAVLTKLETEGHHIPGVDMLLTLSPSSMSSNFRDRLLPCLTKELCTSNAEGEEGDLRGFMVRQTLSLILMLLQSPTPNWPRTTAIEQLLMLGRQVRSLDNAELLTEVLSRALSLYPKAAELYPASLPSNELSKATVGELAALRAHVATSQASQRNVPITLVLDTAREILIEHPTGELAALLAVLTAVSDGSLGKGHADACLELAGEILNRRDATDLVVVEAFHLVCHCIDANAGLEFATLAESVLRKKLQPPLYRRILHSFRSTIAGANTQTKIAVCTAMLDQAYERPTSALPILQQTLRSLNKEALRHESTAAPTEHYIHLLKLSERGSPYTLYAKSFECAITAAQEQRILVNQHGIESTLATLNHLVESAASTMVPVINMNACKMLTILLQTQERRLNGRFHLVCKLLQALFKSVIKYSTQVHQTKSPFETDAGNIAVVQAQSLARVIVFFSNPRQTHVKQANALVDEARKAKAHVGEFLRHVLHHYCAQVLSNAPLERVRQALIPGLFAMIEAIEVGGPDSMASLSAAMNNSQRNVLRGLYDEWKRVGKWTGG